jgi:hypothetical protein
MATHPPVGHDIIHNILGHAVAEKQELIKISPEDLAMLTPEAIPSGILHERPELFAILHQAIQTNPPGKCNMMQRLYEWNDALIHDNAKKSPSHIMADLLKLENDSQRTCHYAGFVQDIKGKEYKCSHCVQEEPERPMGAFTS